MTPLEPMPMLDGNGRHDGVMRRHYGKYRGKVVSNQDKENLGRLKVAVGDVLGKQEVWAMPSVPYAGRDVGWVMPPPDGASVWVEFEGGDPRFPIWSGCFWGPNEIPTSPQDVKDQIKLLKTEAFALAIHDAGEKSELLIELNVGSDKQPRLLQIQCDSSGGIQITDPKQQTVATINSGTITLKSGSSSTATVKGDTISLVNNGGKDTNMVEVSSSEIKLTLGTSASVSMGAAGINLTVGARKIEISTLSVTINGMSLEVK